MDEPAPTTSLDNDWCSVNEAARRLGVTATAIRNRIKRGTARHAAQRQLRPSGQGAPTERLPSPQRNQYREPCPSPPRNG